MDNEKQNFSVDEILEEARSEQTDESLTEDFYGNDEPIYEEEAPKKKKKRRWFGRDKDKSPDFDEEEDAYYGVQVKPLNELRKGYDSTGEINLEDDTFAKLFDDTIPSLDEEVEKNFQRIQRERRRRVAEAVETAGISVDDVADELGIVAPMPVTSFSADPYAKQHGIASEIEDGDEFRKAMLQTAENQTMEIKLNVLNDTVELQKNAPVPVVDEDTVTKILENFLDSPEEMSPEDFPVMEDMDSGEAPYLDTPEPEALSGDTVAFQIGTPAAHTTAPQNNTSLYLDIPQEPMGEFPRVDILEHYRDKVVPIHVVNIDVLQSAILTEANQYEKKEKKESPFRRFAAKLMEEEPEASESIDDYTSPADAKSVSLELKTNMRQLSIRLLVTGLSTVILFICSLVFEGKFASGDPANNPIAYLIITLLLVLVCAGFCLRSILAGLRSLLKFNANSDSAAAVAVAAVLIQTVMGFLYQTPIATGVSHLYGLIVGAVLFLNTLGKLTMLRRIHSNFRFVTAREQKYAVKIYNDYNTSLKLAKDSVAEAPVIAYQQKASFLKRFLQLSYEPDPSETSSQSLAPLGLLASLVLCLVTLIITKDIFMALTAFAASCCVLVATVNMLAVNLPLSRLCKKARRAGAMLVGYEAVSQMARTNAVMMDAADLFPAGTVVLDGVKTFGSDQAESAILAATALMREVGGTLSDVFEQVVNENEEELPRVSNLVLEDEHGVTGSVGGKKVLVGNRTLLMNHHIEPPEREDVTKFTVGGKKVLFVAVDSRLEAMLVLTYKADKRKRNELQRMEENGVSLIVRSTDANITENFIGKIFGIAPSSVSVLTGNLAETYEKLVKDEIPRADALVATKGRVESMTNVISSCVSEKRILTLVVALQNISVILGFVLVAFLCCFSGIGQLSAAAIFLYELFWLVVLLLLPKIKKP